MMILAISACAVEGFANVYMNRYVRMYTNMHAYFVHSHIHKSLYMRTFVHAYASCVEPSSAQVAIYRKHHRPCRFAADRSAEGAAKLKAFNQKRKARRRANRESRADAEANAEPSSSSEDGAGDAVAAAPPPSSGAAASSAGGGGAASSTSHRPLAVVKEEPQEPPAQDSLASGVALAQAVVVKSEALSDIKQELFDASDATIDALAAGCRAALG